MRRWQSSSSFTKKHSSSSSSSSKPWISPLHYPKNPSNKSHTFPATTSYTNPAPGSAEAESRNKKKPTKFISHHSAISLIKREKDSQRALDLFNYISTQNGFTHNNSTYAVILHKLALSKKFQALDSLLHQMATYETCQFHEGLLINLMHHYSRSSLHHKLLHIFSLIHPIVRQKPSLKAISTCLNLLIDSHQIQLARTLLLYSYNNLNLDPNTCIFNIFLKYHCKRGDLQSAFQLLQEMEKSTLSYPNLITYSTLMDALCVNGRLQHALQLFEEMLSKHNIIPDALTYNILITGFCRGGKVDQAKKILHFMNKNGCTPNIFNYSALMNGFCKQGKLDQAKEVFVEMKSAGLKPDKVTYTTLINLLCTTGSGVDEAIELLKEMKANDCKADSVTFNVILGGICREGRFEEAIRMLERLPYEGIYLDKASYRIVLNFLCKGGEGDLDKATELLCVMLSRGFRPHFATSNKLLVRLCETGKANDAAMILSGLVEMGFKPEPESWNIMAELICRERKLLAAFELLDCLVTGDI